jgi:hypothetical protein
MFPPCLVASVKAIPGKRPWANIREAIELYLEPIEDDIAQEENAEVVDLVL